MSSTHGPTADCGGRTVDQGHYVMEWISTGTIMTTGQRSVNRLQLLNVTLQLLLLSSVTREVAQVASVVRHTMERQQNQSQRHRTPPTISSRPVAMRISDCVIACFCLINKLFSTPSIIIIMLSCSDHWRLINNCPCHVCRSSGNIVGGIDWHSYSQLILRPYGQWRHF